MAGAKKDKGKHVEIIAKILHLKDPEYNKMMVTIVENQKINKPILSLEGPKGSSGSNHFFPLSVTPTATILVYPLDIQHL